MIMLTTMVAYKSRQSFRSSLYIYLLFFLPERQQTATVQQRNRTRTDDASWSRLME